MPFSFQFKPAAFRPPSNRDFYPSPVTKVVIYGYLNKKPITNWLTLSEQLTFFFIHGKHQRLLLLCYIIYNINYLSKILVKRNFTLPSLFQITLIVIECPILLAKAVYFSLKGINYAIICA